MVFLLLYIVHDRHDARWAIGELVEHVKIPTMGVFEKLKWLVRYLRGSIKYSTWLDSKGSLDDVVAWVGTDWAGDLQMRRSATSIVIIIGGSVAYASRKSSGEAEYYSASQGAADFFHVTEVMRLFGANPKLKVSSGSTA